MLPRPTTLLLLFTGVALTARAQHLADATSDLERGRVLYAQHCATCHGPHGEGARGPTLAQPTLPRASDADSLLRIIRNGIGGTEMPGAKMQRDEIPLVAAYVKSLGSQPREKVPGDPARGAELYASKGGCAQCHLLNGRGGAIGPDLTQIGRKRSAAYLRRALVEPSAEVPQSYNAFRSDVSMPENYLFVRAEPKKAPPVAGVRVNEDTFSIQIRDVSGRVHSFFKSELAALHKDWGTSVMPSFAGAFAPAELDDMVAFLVSLRGEKTEKQ